MALVAPDARKPWTIVCSLTDSLHARTKKSMAAKKRTGEKGGAKKISKRRKIKSAATVPPGEDEITADTTYKTPTLDKDNSTIDTSPIAILDACKRNPEGVYIIRPKGENWVNNARLLILYISVDTIETFRI